MEYTTIDVGLGVYESDLLVLITMCVICISNIRIRLIGSHSEDNEQTTSHRPPFRRSPAFLSSFDSTTSPGSPTTGNISNAGGGGLGSPYSWDRDRWEQLGPYSRVQRQSS